MRVRVGQSSRTRLKKGPLKAMMEISAMVRLYGAYDQVPGDLLRLLENDDIRILEDGSYRLLEVALPPEPEL